MIELLAPAKDKNTAISAINFGADAVYTGAKDFGARKNAGNSLEDIKEIVDYAHKFYAKVYVTVNTILDNSEIIAAQKLIQELYKIGVDAIIIQDMGLLELELPPVPIFASTQCHNNMVEKVKFFEKLGLQRIILARELSLKEIENICKNTKDIEIETFIHGALCVCYSGQCYMSLASGGRSANRGECAQPCRKKYSLIDKNGNYIAKNKYLLSLKDMNASNYIEKLIEAGVTSFKIEGRLKDENYVKNVVAYYNRILEGIDGCKRSSSGKIFLDFEPDLNKTFNRGFTSYLEQPKADFNFDTPKAMNEFAGMVLSVSEKYFTYKGENLHVQDGLCFLNNGDMEGFLVNKIEGNKIYPNKMPNLKPNTKLYRNFDVEFFKQLENSKTKRKIRVDFELLDEKLIAVDEDNNNVILNFEKPQVAQNQEKSLETIKNQLQKTGESDFYTGKIGVNTTFTPFFRVSEINELRRKILELLMNERLKNYKRQIQKPLKKVGYIEKEVDYKANIHNDFAENFYRKAGTEVKEKSLESSKEFKNRTIMRTKHCLKKAFNMCGQNKELYLIDETSKKQYKLEFDCKNCEMLISLK